MTIKPWRRRSLQQERMTGVRAKNAYVDRGYRRKRVGKTRSKRPDNGAGKTPCEKQKARRCFRRRAAIEPIIGHTKDVYGMRRNYLKGAIGDSINAMLAASAFNFKSWMRKAKKKAIFVFKYFTENWYQPSYFLKLMPSF